MKPAIPVAVAACAVVAALAWWMLRGQEPATPPEGDTARAAPAPDSPPPQLTGAAPTATPRASATGAAQPDTGSGEAPTLEIPKGLGYSIRLDVVDAATGVPFEHPETFVAVTKVVARDPSSNLGRQDTLSCEARLIPPGGLLHWDPMRWTFTASRYARAMHVVYPMRPELDVRVTVLEATGRLAMSEPQLGFDVGGKAVWASALELESVGVWRLRGVPYLPGETLRLQARWKLDAVAEVPAAQRRISNHEPTETEEVLTPVEVITKPTWSGPVPYDRRARIEATVTLPPLGPNGEIMDAELWDHVETDNDMPFEESLREEGVDPPPAKLGSIEVVVRRHGGAPAAGAAVLVHGTTVRTDADGRARFLNLKPGSYQVRVREPGLVASSAKIDVAPGTESLVTLTEPEAGRIDLVVEDAEGRAMPFATVRVNMPSGLPWLDLDGDVQRVDAYVDHLGRRRLSNVEPGDVVVRAWFGNRHGEATVRVVEGSTTRAEIVIK